MQILVTGGAGFIGGHLSETFVREGHTVVALDNFDPYYHPGIKRRNVEQGRLAAEQSDGSYELIEGDVRDEDLLGDLVERAAAVFHLAAQAGVRKSITNPMKPNDVNINGTLTLLEAARDTDVRRIVVASSSSVYGKSRYLPYDEDHPTTPVSPYGVSKLATEQYTRVYNKVYGLPTVALRYFTVYGPRMRPNMAISNFVSRCINGQSPIIYGDGGQSRDFTHIDDIVSINSTLLDDGSAEGEVLNVGSADNIDIESLAREIRDRVSPDLELVYENPRPGEANHTHADISRAADLLNYAPSVTILEGVEKFIDWYRTNRDWYEPLVRSS